MEHRNERYEYTTRETATTTYMEPMRSMDDLLEPDGWQPVWREVTIEGTFTVYRRERAR
jgi:hypothetical protein